MNQMGMHPGEAVNDEVDPNSLTCPTCGLKYAQFRADGRLGCPEDYDVFYSVLVPILERVHRSDEHVGKLPQAIRKLRAASELTDLKERLQDAIRAEEYETAATLRDQIRQKEAAE